MTLRHAQTADTVSAWVQQDFAVEITALSPVDHGADETAQQWRGRGVDGSRVRLALLFGGRTANCWPACTPPR